MALGEGFRRLFRRSDLERDLDDEIQSHLEMKAADLEAAGMSPAEARAEAERRFGDPEPVLRACREIGAGEDRRGRARALLDSVRQDVRYGLRALRGSPMVTAVAAVTLALGIGANTAVYSVVDAVLLSVPISDPDRVVQITDVFPARPGHVAPANFRDYRAQRHVFARFAGIWNDGREPVVWAEPGDTMPVAAIYATSDLLPILGTELAMGRGFTPAEDEAGADHVALVSHRFWQERLSGDPDVIGSSLPVVRLGRTAPETQVPARVVGVLPPDFHLPPMAGDPFGGQDPSNRSHALSGGLYVEVPDVVLSWGHGPGGFTGQVAGRGYPQIRVLAMLREGVTLEDASAAMAALAAEIALEAPALQGYRISVMPLRAMMNESYGGLLVALAAVLLVLLIACMNVAGLLLAKGVGRQRELAVRMALGVGRWRLIRQLLTECVLLTVIGALGGALVAWGGVSALIAVAPGEVYGLDGVGVNGRVLAFTLGVSGLAVLVAGLLPAILGADLDVQRALKEGQPASSSRRRLLDLLVVGEVALTTVLLLGTGLLARSLVRMARVDPGFATEGVLALELRARQPVISRYANFIEERRVTREIMERIGALPGVASVAATDFAPLHGEDVNVVSFGVEDQPDRTPTELPALVVQRVSEEYFDVLGIPVVEGTLYPRSSMDAFVASRGQTGPPWNYVNASAAEEIWGDESPLGRRLRWGGLDSGYDWQTIGAVVGDVRAAGMDRAPRGRLYMPWSGQFIGPARVLTVLARTTGDVDALVDPVIAAVRDVAPEEPYIASVMSMDDYVSRSLAAPRFRATVAGLFAAVAVILAVVGLFGVVSHGVRRRTHELGVRRALGASGREVVALVFRNTMITSVAGLALGGVLAWPLTRVIRSLLYEVAPTDPAILAATFLGLGLVMGAAGYLPAQRAASVDPLDALRSE